MRKRLTTVLREELSRLELRAVDKGKIKGEFEEHYFGKEVELPKEVDITQELCSKWTVQFTKVAQAKRMGTDQISEDLDNLFEDFFNTTLPEGRHVTLQLCNEWRRKHQDFLLEIWQKRTRLEKTWSERKHKDDSG